MWFVCECSPVRMEGRKLTETLRKWMENKCFWCLSMWCITSKDDIPQPNTLCEIAAKCIWQTFKLLDKVYSLLKISQPLIYFVAIGWLKLLFPSNEHLKYALQKHESWMNFFGKFCSRWLKFMSNWCHAFKKTVFIIYILQQKFRYLFFISTSDRLSCCRTLYRSKCRINTLSQRIVALTTQTWRLCT